MTLDVLWTQQAFHCINLQSLLLLINWRNECHYFSYLRVHCFVFDLLLPFLVCCGLDRFNIFYSYNLVPVVLNELFFYPTPNNFNYFYCVGFLLGLLLCFQFMSGLLIACYYIPKVGIAFTSIDYAIRDVAIG